jgi:hypothetical protein
MSGFANSIVGGAATLIRNAIQSRNFSIPSKTGWAIKKDGTAFFYNVTASGTITATTVVVAGATGGVFVYSGVPANGNLLSSNAGTGGTDAFGNVYLGGGFAVYSGSAAVLIGVFGGIPSYEMYTGDTMQQTAANIGTGVVGSGATRYMSSVFSGPQGNGVGFKDWVQILLASNEFGGITAGANGELIYINNAQVAFAMAQWNQFGFNIPGNLNSGWTIPTLSSVGNNATKTIFASSPIPLGQPVVNSIYEMTINGSVVGGGVAESLGLTAQLGATDFGGGAFTGATSYAAGDLWTITIKMQCLGPLGASCKWQMFANGQIATSAGTVVSNLVMGNPGGGITVSSLVANNFTLSAQWGGAGGAAQLFAPLLGKFRQIV